MKLKVWGTCECGCGNRTFLNFVTKPVQVRWFMDYGEWFLYLYLGKRYWRLSSAGYLKGKSR